MATDHESLREILDSIRLSDALAHKCDIKLIADALDQSYCNSRERNGDDTAVIHSGSGYDLLAAEGFMPEFVAQDPWFAGWCGMMVNISDIAAMGGRPVAVVNTLWGRQDDNTRLVLQGMCDASRVFQVPIVGGHTNLHCDNLHLGVAILGKAKRLLRSSAARPGQILVAAIDLRGAYRQPFRNWNAATSAPPDRLRGDLNLLPHIAERGLATAAKDISQAGLLGTCVMLLESSGTGARIDLDRIPRPKGVAWLHWLQTFPSFGYLLTAEKHNIEPLLASFSRRDIDATAIGEITDDGKLIVQQDRKCEIFWDVEQQAMTGFGTRKTPARAPGATTQRCKLTEDAEFGPLTTNPDTNHA